MRAFPFPKSTSSFFRDPLGYVGAHDSGEAVVRLGSTRGRYLLVRDPDAIWRVLVTEGRSFAPGKWKRRARRFLGDTLNTLDGAEHRGRRLLLQPSVARQRVNGFVPGIVARVEEVQEGWKDGARIHLRGELDPLALTVAGDVLLSTNLEPQARALAAALRTVMAGVPRFTPPLAGTRQGRALARVDRTVAAVINARRQSADSGDDLVGALTASGLSERTVRGELIAFLLAAVDEPPSALEAAWYLLGRHPAAEESFHAELDAVLGDRAPEVADGARLPYLDAVLCETLRLFPPARHIDRCPVHDVRIGGERVRAGTYVLVSPFVTHREAHLYDQPAIFAPERWLESRPGERPRGTYVPFGAGVHACIGQPLARAIMTFTLATIGRRWRVHVPADAPLPVPRARKLFVTLERR